MLTTNPGGSSAPLKSQNDSINTSPPPQSPISPARRRWTISGNKSACDGLRARPGPATNKNVRALCRALNETCGSDSRPIFNIPSAGVKSHACGHRTPTATVPRMNLEDHLGDIICKARAMSGVSAATAAARREFPKPNCPRWKKPGKPRRKSNFATLAPLIG